MKRCAFDHRNAVLRLAVGACSLAVLGLGLGAFGRGEAQQGTVSIEVLETVGVSDAQQALPPASAGADEGVGVTDLVSLVPPASIEVYESVLVGDSQQAVPPASVDTSEGVQVSDAVEVVPPASIDVHEAIGVSDGQQVVPPASIEVDEAIGVSDQSRFLLPAVIEISEAIGVADTLGDSDRDGAADLTDNCATTSNANQADPDSDSVGTSCDNCPATANGPGQRFVLGAGYQTDSDGDGLPGTQPPFDGIFGGDACDVDDDNDGVADIYDVFCRTMPEDFDGYQDNDGCPDTDNDLDGILDVADTGRYCFDPAGTLACHLAAASDCRNVAEDIDGFRDTDGCPEPDNDNDAFPDTTDACPGTTSVTGPDEMLGSPQDLNHNGIRDLLTEGVFTTDDVVKTFEDFDGVLDNDGCHDSPGKDFDGDGYTDDNEALRIGTNPGYPCGINGWPSDLYSQDLSFNELDVQDIISFIAPVRRLDSSPSPTSNYLARWDLAPGANFPFTNHISIFDITTMLNGVVGSPGYPPMFEGPRAFGKVCPLAPQ